MPSEPDIPTVHHDAIVIGGGIAALWSAVALRQSGRSVRVLSNSPIGSGQTLAAQGVIHGGLKYAVGGKLTDSSEALAEMPARWRRTLDGNDEIDLSRARLLSDHQILWSLPGVVSKAVGFFGSRAVRGRARTLAREDYPALFDTDDYRGRLFRIEEPVVDSVSVVSELARHLAGRIHRVEWGRDADWDIRDGRINSILTRTADGKSIRLTASDYVLAAGAGNGPLLEALDVSSPRQQLRPLHQLIIRRRELPDFYSVCVGKGPKPPMVTTTHRDREGRTIWYVGGEIAEREGVERSKDAQIDAGRDLFRRLLPWVDLEGAEWFTWRGDRAEPLTESGARPPGSYCRRVGNAIVTWPTKLALAPDLADRVVAEASAPLAHPGDSNSLPLPPAEVGLPPWDLP